MWRSSILKSKRKKAFLLVEVLLTIAILTIGLTALVRSFFISLQAGKLAADYIQAAQLLDNSLSLLEMQGGVTAGLQTEKTFSAPNERFKFKLDTQNIKIGEQPGPLNNVAAAVIWTVQKQNRSITAVTYLENLNEENK